MARDPTGGDWLGPLLAATPHGRAVLGDTIGSPGELLEALRQPGTNGLQRCFEYPVCAPAPTLDLVHRKPGRAVWPRGAKYSETTTTLRRALLDDEPPGRSEAQRQARELVATRPPNAREWWRFEGESMLDCVLMSDRLVVTIEGKRTEPISATTEWYPKRSQLVRNIEAAKQLAHGRQWCSILISEQPIPEGSDGV
jgi:hypothetical protein